MSLKQIIPPPTAVLREGLIVLGGIIVAAFIISRIPRLQAFVQSNSVTLKDSSGNVIW